MVSRGTRSRCNGMGTYTYSSLRAFAYLNKKSERQNPPPATSRLTRWEEEEAKPAGRDWYIKNVGAAANYMHTVQVSGGTGPFTTFSVERL